MSLEDDVRIALVTLERAGYAFGHEDSDQWEVRGFDLGGEIPRGWFPFSYRKVVDVVTDILRPDQFAATRVEREFVLCRRRLPREEAKSP